MASESPISSNRQHFENFHKNSQTNHRSLSLSWAAQSYKDFTTKLRFSVRRKMLTLIRRHLESTRFDQRALRARTASLRSAVPYGQCALRQSYRIVDPL